jgi:hypothetical protein
MLRENVDGQKRAACVEGLEPPTTAQVTEAINCQHEMIRAEQEDPSILLRPENEAIFLDGKTPTEKMMHRKQQKKHPPLSRHTIARFTKTS